MKKLSEQELQELKSIQETYNNLLLQLGDYSVRIRDHKKVIEQIEEEKNISIGKIDSVRKQDEELTKRLSDKYGYGKINIETGEITDN